MPSDLPDRPVVALVGDGAMQMNNLAELITVQKYWKQWRDPRLIVCVFNNGDLNEVTWEQRVMEGNPRFPDTQDIPDVPYAKFAEMLGLKGISVDHADALAPAWIDALSADRPVVIEVKTDPEVPPLPPHVTLAEAKAFIETYFTRFAGVRRFLDATVEQARERGYVETILGRRRYIPELTDRNFNIRAFGERTAQNSPIQGSAADLIKVAMIRVHDRIRLERLESRMLLQVHDELVFEAPPSEVDALRTVVDQAMTTAVPLDVPLVVDFGVGDNWVDAKG